MNVTDIPVKSIKPPLGRARRNFGDIESLKQSIKEQGLIQPLVVKDNLDGTYTLVAGERRLRAILALEWETVPASILPSTTDTLDEKVIELYENLMRKDFDWVEEVQLKKRIHDLQVKKYGEKLTRKKDDPGWSMRKTAEMLGESISNVSRDIQLAELLDEMPELAKNKNKAKAYKLVQNAARVVHAEEIEKAIRQEIKTNPNSTKKKLLDWYVIGDFLEEAQKLPDKSFDLIEIDPPYGIDLQGQKRDAGAGIHSYNEVPISEYETFITNVIREAERLLKDNGWLLLWYAPEPHQELMYNTLRIFRLKTRRIPAIWKKPNGQVMHPDIYLANDYEFFLYARKGSAKLQKQGRSAIFEFSIGSKEHPTEKPVNLMMEILSTFAEPGSNVLVPFAGGGSTLIAAYKLGMVALGYDLSETYRSIYIRKLNNLEG